jgi:hypothetical protein
VWGEAERKGGRKQIREKREVRMKRTKGAVWLSVRKGQVWLTLQ